MKIETRFSSINSSGKRIPAAIPFLKIKNKILGAKYELSLAFVSPEESRKTNKEYRQKDEPANILTFPISPSSGEILINPEKAQKDAPDFEMNFKKFLTLLFIHGCLHLKGIEHGSIMESEETRLLSLFA